MKHLRASFLLIASLAVAMASAAERVALVIGNGAYEHASKLANATNDSTAIAKLLKGERGSGCNCLTAYVGIQVG
jgi:hypothetical protein